MFFLLKCFFWLALVYAAILYGIGPFGSFSDGRLSDHATIGGSAREHAAALQGVIDTAVGSAVGFCTGRPAECTAQASRLTALVQASMTDPSPIEAPKAVPRSTKGHEAAWIARDPDIFPRIFPKIFDEAPMPVPDPRRQGRAFKLTPKS